MKIDNINEKEMILIAGGGPGCWLGKNAAKLIYALSCNYVGLTLACAEIFDAKQEAKNG